jgi:protocatechuate 3,4-dioxygenase beta subunit
MKRISFVLSLCFFTLAGCGQNSPTIAYRQQATGHVGGGCEGCEAIHESPIPFSELSWTDTLPDFYDAGPKLEISGIIYQRDGKTPAPDVVLYIYHTNQQGIYPTRGNETGWAKRHGYIRGWVKTNTDGRYRFFTLRPAAYPGGENPQHIHPIIKEPNLNEYYIDEYLFAGDPILKAHPQKEERRGGSGIIKVQEKDGMQFATRHIILGLNVPDYPVAATKSIQSGLALGANCPAFAPLHLSGADVGTKACPMCKYGAGQGLMVWFNHANPDQLKPLALQLEAEMMRRGEGKLRVFLIYMNPFYNKNDTEGTKILQRKLTRWCEDQNLQKVALVWVPSPIDENTCQIYRINPEAKNTVFLYKKRMVVAKWINMDYDQTALKTVFQQL